MKTEDCNTLSHPSHLSSLRLTRSALTAGISFHLSFSLPPYFSIFFYNLSASISSVTALLCSQGWGDGAVGMNKSYQTISFSVICRVWVIIQFSMREHLLIRCDPAEFPRLWDGKLINSERCWREWTPKYSNLPPLSPSLPALTHQICVTKWTYNWNLGGPDIAGALLVSHLEISSGELWGW